MYQFLRVTVNPVTQKENDRMLPPPPVISPRRIRRCTLQNALRHFVLSALFFAGAVPLWFGLWFVIYIRTGRAQSFASFDGPGHRGLALTLAAGILIFGFLGLFFRHFKMETEEATLKENPANPLWQIALLPAFLSTQGVRHLLQCLALLTVNHGDLMPVLKQIHRSRFYLSALKEQYPLTHQWLQTALQALPGVQILHPEMPYLILSAKARAMLFQGEEEDSPDDGEIHVDPKNRYWRFTGRKP